MESTEQQQAASYKSIIDQISSDLAMYDIMRIKSLGSLKVAVGSMRSHNRRCTSLAYSLPPKSIRSFQEEANISKASAPTIRVESIMIYEGQEIDYVSRKLVSNRTLASTDSERKRREKEPTIKDLAK